MRVALAYITGFFTHYIIKDAIGFLLIRYIIGPVEPWVRRRAQDEGNTISRWIVTRTTWIKHHWLRHQEPELMLCPQCEPELP